MLALGGLYVAQYLQTLQRPLGEDFRRIVGVQLRRELTFVGIFILVFFIEGLLYWKFRYHAFSRWLAVGHLAGWLLAILVIPLLSFAILHWVGNEYSNEYFSTFAPKLTIVQKLAIRASLIIGHLCFVLVLVDAYKKKKHPEQNTDDDAEHFLNDYNA